MDVITSASRQPYFLCQVDRNEEVDLDVRILGYSERGYGGDAMRP